MSANTEESKQRGASQLVGLFLLGDIDEHRMGHQGRVMAYLVNGAYLVQFYSWLSGEPTNLGVVDLTEMARLRFFNNEEDWRCAGSKLLATDAAKAKTDAAAQMA